MENVDRGVKFTCSMTPIDSIYIVESDHNPRGAYLGISKGVSITAEDVKLLIEALVRLRDTGHIHPPELPRVEELEEKVKELETRLRVIKGMAEPNEEQ